MLAPCFYCLTHPCGSTWHDGFLLVTVSNQLFFQRQLSLLPHLTVLDWSKPQVHLKTLRLLLPSSMGALFSIHLKYCPEKAMAPHSSTLLPGKSRGWRSLVGCSPWGREESDTTGRLHFNVSLSCIGEGNGNPLQCSCLENPRDGGAWWAAVYGVTQSDTTEAT